ncbi:MAG: hypothetical protein EXR05_06355 [Acetobacteraceae bacterium]|nr:hypothetical protein [Acetobacteraceae bacterium]
MTIIIATHKVDDIQHCLQSKKREELFGPLGIKFRTFVDAKGSNLVGLMADVPDMDALMQMLQSPAGAESMKHDGVHPDTI